MADALFDPFPIGCRNVSDLPVGCRDIPDPPIGCLAVSRLFIGCRYFFDVPNDLWAASGLPNGCRVVTDISVGCRDFPDASIGCPAVSGLLIGCSCLVSTFLMADELSQAFLLGVELLQILLLVARLFQAFLLVAGRGDGEHAGGEEWAGRDGNQIQIGPRGPAACRYSTWLSIFNRNWIWSENSLKGTYCKARKEGTLERCQSVKQYFFEFYQTVMTSHTISRFFKANKRCTGS